MGMMIQMSDAVLTIWTAATVRVRSALADEAGEGVISTAIAVLVMAAVGVVMWGLFQGTIGNADSAINEQIQQIGG